MINNSHWASGYISPEDKSHDIYTINVESTTDKSTALRYKHHSHELKLQKRFWVH